MPTDKRADTPEQRLLPFGTALARHLRWQRALLRSALTGGPRSASKHMRFLVLRPGDQLTVCQRSGMADVRAHCYRAGRPPYARPVGMHWDTHIIHGRSDLSRPVPGLGNVALSLVAAAATAIVSRRVLLLENYSASGASFGPPLSEILVETSGWAPFLASSAADELDGWAAHDDYSSFGTLCGADLRTTPEARVWRIFSNQYWLPLLLLNPHHQRQVEAMAEPLTPASAYAVSAGGGGGSGGFLIRAALAISSSSRGSSNALPPPSLWTPALRALWTPAPRLAARIASFEASSRLRDGPYVAMHIRVSLSQQSDGRNRLAEAVTCVRSRLAAANASRLFVATMYQSNRRALSSALAPHGVSVHWFGKSMEAQAESTAGSDSALADMLLMGGAAEVLVTPGSTFGYVAQGLAGSRATTYGGTHTSRELVGKAGPDCAAVATSEPNFHFLQHALRAHRSCKAGAGAALARHSEMYQRSAMKH